MTTGHYSIVWKVSYVQLCAGQGVKGYVNGAELYWEGVVQQRQNS